jgi:hypothetical protein
VAALPATGKHRDRGRSFGSTSGSRGGGDPCDASSAPSSIGGGSGSSSPGARGIASGSGIRATDTESSGGRSDRSNRRSDRDQSECIDASGGSGGSGGIGRAARKIVRGGGGWDRSSGGGRIGSGGGSSGSDCRPRRQCACGRSDPRRPASYEARANRVGDRLGHGLEWQLEVVNLRS